MSAPTVPSVTADTHAHAVEESKFWIYVQIAMLLAVITGLELVTVYLPFNRGLIIGVLAVLSAVKFLFVIFYFMHLRWDKAFCTVLFFIGLVLAGGTMWALLRLFGSEAARPLPMSYEDSRPAIADVGRFA
jgi:cytochrome c oxidase subunit IV